MMLHVDDEIVKEAARVTIAYWVVFVLGILYQVVAKKLAIKDGHKKEKESGVEKFNRYSSGDPSIAASGPHRR